MSEPRTTPNFAAWAIHEAQEDRASAAPGRYIDDFVLPGILYMDIVRSPHAHARIRRSTPRKRSRFPACSR